MSGAADDRPQSRHDFPPADDICRLSAVELGRKLRRRELSSREVVAAFLDRIDKVNPTVNAIVSLRDRDDINGAETEVASLAPNDAAPEPPLRPTLVDEQVQVVAVRVPAGHLQRLHLQRRQTLHRVSPARLGAALGRP